jgi:hypothetical protein
MRTSQYKVQDATLQLLMFEHRETCASAPLRTGLTTDHAVLDRTWPGKHGSSRLPTPTTRRHWQQHRLLADCSKLSADPASSGGSIAAARCAAQQTVGLTELHI